MCYNVQYVCSRIAKLTAVNDVICNNLNMKQFVRTILKQFIYSTVIYLICNY